MNCPICDAEVTEKDNFCPSCGIQLSNSDATQDEIRKHMQAANEAVKTATTNKSAAALLFSTQQNAPLIQLMYLKGIFELLQAIALQNEMIIRHLPASN